MSEAQTTSFRNYSDVPEVQRVRRARVVAHLDARQVSYDASLPKDILLVIAQANGIDVLKDPPPRVRPIEEAQPVMAEAVAEPQTAEAIEEKAPETIGEKPDFATMHVSQLRSYIKDHSSYAWEHLKTLGREELLSLIQNS